MYGAFPQGGGRMYGPFPQGGGRMYGPFPQGGGWLYGPFPQGGGRMYGTFPQGGGWLYGPFPQTCGWLCGMRRPCPAGGPNAFPHAHPEDRMPRPPRSSPPSGDGFDHAPSPWHGTDRSPCLL